MSDGTNCAHHIAGPPSRWMADVFAGGATGDVARIDFALSQLGDDERQHLAHAIRLIAERNIRCTATKYARPPVTAEVIPE